MYLRAMLPIPTKINIIAIASGRPTLFLKEFTAIHASITPPIKPTAAIKIVNSISEYELA